MPRDKESERARTAEWRARNPERVQAHNRAWRAKSLVRYILYRSKRRAEKVGIEFNLTAKWLEERLSKGTCEVTRLPLDLSGGVGPWVPSIDRIKNDEGYTESNCRIVVFAYNIARSTWDDKVLITLAKAILGAPNE